jgi:hypothetical protein
MGRNISGLRPQRPGEPRKPGSGRKKGTKNRVVVAARELCGELIHDANYQYKLRRDFAVRRIHPAIEALVWAYAIGKPKESLELSGQLDISQRLTAERDLLRNTLDAAELEALAAESQATLDRAIEAAKARRQLVAAPQDIVVQAEPAKDPPESLGSQAGSDM